MQGHGRALEDEVGSHTTMLSPITDVMDLMTYESDIGAMWLRSVLLVVLFIQGIGR